MSQFANWHSKKPDRQNNPGSCDRASRSEDSATADCILGMLASFSTVFCGKIVRKPNLVPTARFYQQFSKGDAIAIFDLG